MLKKIISLNLKILLEEVRRRPIHFFRPVREHAGTVRAYREIGNAYRILGDFEMAKQCLSDARKHMSWAQLSNGPEYALLLNDFGNLCHAQGRLWRAEGHFSRAIDLNANHPVPGRELPHIGIAAVYRDLGLPELAAHHARMGMIGSKL